MMFDFELVMPAYNEGENLPIVIKNTINAAKKYGFNSNRFQLILVNNGSTDNSSAIIKSILKSPAEQWIKLISIKENVGYGHGIWAGLQASSAEYVAWTHADMQCDIENVFKGLTLLQESSKNTIVKGFRIGRNWKDTLVSRFFEILAWLILGHRIREINAQPKVFHRSLLPLIKSPPIDFAFDLYVLYVAKKAGFASQSIQVLFPPRIHGVSKWASNFFSKYKTIILMIRFMLLLKQQRRIH